MLTLPWSRPGYPPQCVALPEGEDRVRPMASKLVCRPALTNTGWPGSHGAAGTAADDEEEEEDAKEDLPPSSECMPLGEGVPSTSNSWIVPWHEKN